MKVLVLVVSGMHPGFVGCYGNEWLDTPALDRLAAEGIVFDQHYAVQPERAAARQVLRTGRYLLPRPGIELLDPQPDSVDLFHHLHASGVNTVTIEQPTGPGSADRGGALTKMAALVVQAVKAWHAQSHSLIYVECPSLLSPWGIAEEFLPPDEAGDGEDAKLGAADQEILARQRQYAAVITQFDRWLGQLLAELERDGMLDELHCLLTSDHGQLLMEERAAAAAGSSLHEEIIHIPLIARLPGKAEAGRRVAALTQTVDLFPTLCDWFGVPAPVVHGHSLLPLLQGTTERIRAYAVAGARLGDWVEWALRTPEWGLVVPAQPAEPAQEIHPRLHVKPDDRWEVNDLYQHHQEWAERLEQTLQAFVQAARGPGPWQPPELPAFVAASTDVNDESKHPVNEKGTPP
jgi:arylsulfatase A-like enzyme